ncbi:uncharacterized protein LOC112455544 [Temnothorax curvispinosus]|uniref:Uncharacterized protein LOC112455544 n=1 Tax=Temnothorax curvispinosus TaxID=300111 RepID=A0A6J1PTV0_9HYME|nr:uncharacterized protein LOC112455544 [Temnothorax curvispinosus]XP_024873307.1 uncharacterized protein LOC112455544 [Temnothorax curvispinosus]
MELINSLYNDFINNVFYATVCHVCKQFGDGVSLKRCGSCRMIAYCGREHQKQHWKQHKSLCKAIQDALQEYNFNGCGKDSEDCDDKKLIFTRLVLRKLGRHLKLDEMQMFTYPKECLICHEKNDKLLEDCQKCAASFCKKHKDDTAHRDICAPLELGFHSDLLGTKKFNSPVELLSDLKRVSDASTFQNMKDFVNALGNIQTDSEMPYDILAAEYSQYLTRPLTLLYAMRLLNYVPKGKDLVIHVVGANYIEVVTLLTWRVLLHLSETVMSFVIIMIGPDLKKIAPSRTCDKCKSLGNKSVIFEYHDVLYENYVCKPSFVKPDLIVGFNLSIEEHEFDSSKKIWASSIHAVAKQNCPFILTFFTLRYFEEGTKKMNTILGKEVDYLYSGKNPFASFRPHRILGPERVYYHNQYVVIYESLCS